MVVMEMHIWSLGSFLSCDINTHVVVMGDGSDINTHVVVMGMI